MGFFGYLLFCIVWAIVIYGLWTLAGDEDPSGDGFMGVAILMMIPAMPLMVMSVLIHKVWLYVKTFPTIFKKKDEDL